MQLLTNAPTLPTMMPAPAGDAHAALVAGKPVIVIDPIADEGHMLSVAVATTAETVTTMATQARGIVSILLGPEEAFGLGLRHMQKASRSRGDRPYYLASIEAATGTETGISAADRALTIRTAGSPEATAEDLVTPGHVMPILVERFSTGIHAEALRLLQRATGQAVAAWCSILDDAGEMASADYVRDLAVALDLQVIELSSETRVS